MAADAAGAAERLSGPLEERVLIRVLVTLLLVALAGWLFLELGDEVIEQEPIAFDESLLLALRDPENLEDPLGPWWLEEAMRDISALGSSIVGMLFTGVVVIYLLLARRPRLALFTGIAVYGGMAVIVLAKGLFARERPDVVPHLVFVGNEAFPSGHSMIATIMYLTLALLVAQLTRSGRLRAYIVAVAVAVAVLVGFTRVYLGVHYPSDVVGGWALGIAWALPWGLALRYVERPRSAVQPLGDVGDHREEGARPDAEEQGAAHAQPERDAHAERGVGDGR